MSRKLLITLILALCAAAVPAQQTDSLSHGVHARADSLPDSLTLKNNGLKADSVGIDNTKAVELMRQSQEAEVETALKESILTDLLLNVENARQRRELEKQMEELRRQDSTGKAARKQMIDSLKKTAVGAPVRLKQDTLYFIYTNLGAVSASERAALQTQKILNAAKMYSLKTDSLFIISGNSTTDIAFRDIVIGSVTDNDALWMDQTRDSLAIREMNLIAEAIKEYKKRMGVWNILRVTGLCVLVVLVLWGLFKGVSHLFNGFIRRWIISRKDKWFKGISLRNLQILNPKRQMMMFLSVARFIKYIIYIILLYIAIPIIFSIFPPTQGYAEMLFSWILTPVKSALLGFVDFLPNLIKIVVILIIVRYVTRILKYMAREIEEKRLSIPGFYSDWAKTTFSIIRIVIYALTFVLVFQLLPWADSPVFQGVSVFFGLLVSLGSTSVISNLMSGMVITYMRPFLRGDRIRVGEAYGDVVEKTPFVVRILTPKNEVISVPNSVVLSTNVINYSAKTREAEDTGLILNTIVTMGYNVPWPEVNKLLIDAALRTRGILATPPPFVLQTALNDSTASYQLNAYTKDASKMPSLYSEIHKNIQDVFRDAGVEMTSSHYHSIRDGNASTVPPHFDAGRGGAATEAPEPAPAPTPAPESVPTPEPAASGGPENKTGNR